MVFLAVTAGAFFLAALTATFLVLGCADLGFTVFFDVSVLAAIVFGVDFVIPQKPFLKYNNGPHGGLRGISQD